MRKRFTLRRDGSVVVDGVVVGRTWGEPRRWWWSTPYPVPEHIARTNGYDHARRDAAEVCVMAYLEYLDTSSGGQGA